MTTGIRMNDRVPMRIECITEGRFGVNTYCICCENQAILIDPVLSQDLISLLKQYDVSFAVVTHEHFDHISGVNDIQEQYGIRVLCGEKALKALSDPAMNLSKYAGFLAESIPFGNHAAEEKPYSCSPDGTLTDGQMIQWNGHRVLIKETPGHSTGSISLLLDDMYLFSGDVIFREYPTATRMPGGSTKQFRQITQPWLASLPQNVTVYPGHTEPFALRDRYQQF